MFLFLKVGPRVIGVGRTGDVADAQDVYDGPERVVSSDVVVDYVRHGAVLENEASGGVHGDPAAVAGDDVALDVVVRARAVDTGAVLALTFQAILMAVVAHYTAVIADLNPISIGVPVDHATADHRASEGENPVPAVQPGRTV